MLDLSPALASKRLDLVSLIGHQKHPVAPDASVRVRRTS